MKRVKTIWKVFLAIIIIIMGMLILIPVSAKNSKPLRCLIFYSNVKGVNSMIAQAASIFTGITDRMREAGIHCE